jgi:hypothetical protein
MRRTNLSPRTTTKTMSASDRNPDHIQACPVLSFGYGNSELSNKHKALLDIGFEITTLSNFDSVKNLIAQEGSKYKILLIGRLVPPQQREMLSRLYRQYCPEGNVILFYQDSIRDTHGATAVLSEQHSPANLLDAINAIQNRREQH